MTSQILGGWCTEIGDRAGAAPLYFAVDVASVPVAERGVSGVLSFPAGASAGELDVTLSFAACGTATITVLVEVEVRPEMPVIT